MLGTGSLVLVVSQLWRLRRLMGKELLSGSGSDGVVVGAFGVAGFGAGGGGDVGVDEEGGDCGALVNGGGEEAVVS